MGKYLLFIDDDKTFLYLIERVCQKIETVSKLATAKNGSEAIEKINGWLESKEVLPDVIFIDINMPVMGGFEFLAELKEIKYKTQELDEVLPVVMLTSSYHNQDKEKAFATGIVGDYIIKPASITELEQEIRRAIE